MNDNNKKDNMTSSEGVSMTGAALIFDLETDGLLDEGGPDGKGLTKIHCIVTRDLAGDVRVYHNEPSIQPWHGTVAAGAEALTKADTLIGHNIAEFDLPALRRLYPLFTYNAVIRDTLVKARLHTPDIKPADLVRCRRGATMPTRLIGRHSLEAWGHRVGVLKGDFSKSTDWLTFTQEMLDYCIQDTLVTAYLLELLNTAKLSPQSVELEHAFARVLGEQERAGVLFDVKAAEALCQHLQGERATIDVEIADTIPAFVEEYETKVKKIKKKRTITFNPNSRDHIARYFIERYGWKPTAFTEGEGKPQIDETVLAGIPHPEARLLEKRLLIQKRLGQIAEGKQAWLKLVKADGRIHGRINHNGTVTGRCTHSSPNMTAVPKVKLGKKGTPEAGKPLLGAAGAYGWECRSLFIARPGHLIVGADASGLELRMLAHFLSYHDGGAYVRVVLDGDPHNANMEAAGLTSRDDAKTFIYAYLYGAGDELIGTIVGKTGEAARRAGKKLKALFLERTPGLRDLRQGLILRAAKRGGYLVGLDGRRIAVRSQHSMLNALLQCAGAVCVKQATVLFHQQMTSELGLVLGRDYWQIIHAHDELQNEVPEQHAQRAGEIAVESFRRAGEVLKLRCRLDGEFKVGRSWAETH